MAFTKTWNGAGSGAVAGDYSDSRNWEKISLRTAAYSWTQVGATAEWYVRTSGGANPGFAAAPSAENGVYISGVPATAGMLGSLGAGEWAYGDPDTLGYNTIVVRISGGGDPDSQLADYVQFRQRPYAAENVRIPAGSSSISSSLDQSGVAIEGFYVEEGYDGTIGSAAGYLRIDPNVFEVDSEGQAWIDLHSAAITATIHGTGNSGNGEHGLYLRGSALALVDARGGDTGIAVLPSETSAVTTLRITGKDTSVKCGAGVALSSIDPMFSGKLWLHCNASVLRFYGGSVWLREAAAITNVHALGADCKFYWGSTGNITTYNARGGMLDMRAGNYSRTMTTLNLYTTSGHVSYNKEAVTITNHTLNDSVVANYSAT